MLSLLTVDATWSMLRTPQLVSRTRRHLGIACGWSTHGAFASPARSSIGQLAVGGYIWSQQADAYIADALDRLSVRKDRICSLVGFLSDVDLGRLRSTDGIG
jgi:hypothetical protein